jgi:RNA polymerase sigma-70 factor, ECF subfamily
MGKSREHSEPSRVQLREREKNSDRNNLALLSDEELAVLLQQDVDEAFGILVLRFQDSLMNYLYRFLGSRETAEDLLQETFIRLHEKRMLFQPIGRFSTWIYTIASNLAKSELRRPQRRYTVNVIREPEYEEDLELEIVDVEPGPDKRVDMHLKNERIEKELARLPEAFREAVVLRDVQDLPYDEICDILDLPLGTIKSRINRGRKMLKKLLKDIYD